MPSPTEEMTWKDLAKHPKLLLIYALFGGIGWLADRFVPDDCHKEVTRWQSLYYSEHRGKDSLQKTKDILYEDLLNHKQKDKVTDSLIYRLGKKSDQVFKNKHHEK
jgi:hypothetical protein